MGSQRCIVFAWKIHGIKVVVKGRGKIINQSIPRATPLTKGSQCLWNWDEISV
mgnify:CR=1 FL=1